VKGGTILFQKRLPGSPGPAVGASAVAQAALRLEGSYNRVEKEQAIVYSQMEKLLPGLYVLALR